MHSHAFGGVRFALFPVQIAVVVGIATWLLTFTTIDPSAVVLGGHALVLLFGVHLGSTAFEGNDALENVFGDVTYVMFSTRTLPVSARTVFGVFLLKDVLYYSALFVLPITLGLSPLYALTSASVTVPEVALTFISLVLTFVFGSALSVLAISLRTVGSVGTIAIVGSIGAAIAAFRSGVPIMHVTPYGLLVADTVGNVAVSVGGVVAVTGGAVAMYSPGQTRGRRDRARGSYQSLQRFFPDRFGLLPVKMVMDVRRSSGGLSKVGFVAGVLFAVAAFALWGVESALGVSIRPGVAFGSLLSLTAFTTYTWLTQLDGPAEYVFHPLSIRDVFHAKYVAFAVLTVPVGVVFYGTAVLYYQPTLLDAVVGGIVFAEISVYVFGITVLLAGLDPNEFMFDTVSYGVFAVCLTIGLVPVLIASFATAVGSVGSTVLVVWCTVLVGVGSAACWVAPERWERKYRAG